MADQKIKCPRCKKLALTQPQGVTSYYDPTFECKTPRCLFRGRLKWIEGEGSHGITTGGDRVGY